MIHIAITAGGTEEDIDGVRKITNFSTGALGWHLLEAVLDFMAKNGNSDFHVHYIHAAHALIKPLDEKHYTNVTLLPVTDTESVYDTVETLMNKTKIDCFIHSMAISDFTFSYAADISELAMEIYNELNLREDNSPEVIEQILMYPTIKFCEGKKVTSKRDILLGLKPTRKVIAMIKNKQPNVFLVAFKLLRNADEVTLLEVANDLAQNNRCDMVLANDLSEISEENHRGILLQHGVIIARAEGKKAVAEMIVQKSMRQIHMT